MNIKTIKLKSIATDKATGLSGALTMLCIDTELNVLYVLQPKGLNEDGQPFKSFWVTRARLIENFPNYEIDIPSELLGTEVEDEVTGFKGTVTSLYVHVSGCVHADIQPKGHNKGVLIDALNIDVRRLKGDTIKPLSEKAREESEKDHPSPGPSMRFTPSAKS